MNQENFFGPMRMVRSKCLSAANLPTDPFQSYVSSTQLNVFGVGFPIKMILGLLLIGVTLPYLGGWISNELQLSHGDAETLAGLGVTTVLDLQPTAASGT